MTGEVSPAAAVQSGRVLLTGNPALLDRFVELFRIPRSAGGPIRGVGVYR